MQPQMRQTTHKHQRAQTPQREREQLMQILFRKWEIINEYFSYILNVGLFLFVDENDLMVLPDRQKFPKILNGNCFYFFSNIGESVRAKCSICQAELCYFCHQPATTFDIFN